MKFFPICAHAALLIFATISNAFATFAAGKMQVLATFPPMACFAKNVAGNAADVKMLLPPNIGPHDFALSPRDLLKVANADVIVYNGLGLETWLEKTVRSGAKKNALFLEASKGIATIDQPPNPHVWLDPIFAISEVKNIAAGFAKRDPANAAIYRRNAAAYIIKLRKLDSDIRAGLKKIKQRRIITFHDSFPYFAKRYGFKILGVFEQFPGKAPTPRTLLKLRNKIIKDHVGVLFTEPQYSTQLLRSMASDLKIPIVAIDPMETGQPTATLYETVMRKNLRALIDALK